jgi:phage shock protein PspC (stress-responsive transcriptional regulator)
VDKTITISLTGHADRYRLDQAAYDRLASYLDRAGERLREDPDRAEVIGDLERSVGDRLAALVGSEDRLIATTDIDAILEEVGGVDTGRDPAPEERGRAPRTARRLYRVREGKELAGVCTGLAAYSEIPVDWVRTIFVIGTLVTAGILGLVYLALAFILPMEARPETQP